PPMPDCTALSNLFPKLGRRTIELTFDGGDVTSDAGVLLIQQIDRRLGLLEHIAPLLPDGRDPDRIRHTTLSLLRQRVYAIAQGYEDLNDHDRFRHDLVLQTALGRVTPAASSPTLCRFENREDRAAAVAMQRELVEQFIASFT